MFECRRCGKKCGMRTEHLLHISVCNRYRSLDSSYCATEVTPSSPVTKVISEVINFGEEETSWEQPSIDDTDEDPDWMPSSGEEPQESPSSPITSEQESLAAFAEENLIPDEVWLSQDTDNQEKFKEGQCCQTTHVSTKKSVTSEMSHQEDESSVGNFKVIEGRKTSISVKEKLKMIRLKIDMWNEKRKIASKLGKKSTARRITKNIKKYEILSADIAFEEEITTVENHDCLNLPLSSFGLDGDKEQCKEKKNTEENIIGRKLNYCIYCKKLVKKFGEHLQSKHKDSQEGQLLLGVNCGNPTEKRKAKIKITDPIRKQWNAIYNQDTMNKKTKLQNNDELIPVKRRHGGKAVPSVMCKHCLGQYRKDKLSVHLKNCEAYLSHSRDSANNSQLDPHTLQKETSKPLKLHSLPNVANFEGMTSQFKTEILQGINLDDVMNFALSDPTIMKFGISFHKSRREPSCKTYIIREMRDLAKLVMNAKAINPQILTLHDCFNPLYFDTLIAAALQLAKYNVETGVAGVPSIAYRLSQPLKIAALLVKNELVTEVYEKGADRSNITMIDDFLQILNISWKTELGRICSKSQKKARVNRVDKMALENDIIKMAAYLEGLYRQLLLDLENEAYKHEAFDMLCQVLVVHIMLLVRRRPVDFKHAKLQHYNNLDSHDHLIDMVKVNGLTETELEACKRFHLFYVPGKNLEVVPMVLTPLMKTVLDTLIKYRSYVNINCDTLFILSNEKHINPSESLKLMKKKVTLEKPTHFTGNGLRHQAATFSKLHSSHPQYQDYLASALGHTLAVHKKHYDLPLGVLQKIMVCPILENIMTGKKSHEEKNVEDQNQCEEELHDLNQPEHVNEFTPTKSVKDKQVGLTRTKHEKHRWTREEQSLVFNCFSVNIFEKRNPPRSEVVKFMREHGHKLKNRTLAQVVIYIRNNVMRKQLNVSPKVKRIVGKFSKEENNC